MAPEQHSSRWAFRTDRPFGPGSLGRALARVGEGGQRIRMARILYVEDDPSMVVALSQVLKRAGHDVLNAGDAGAALRSR